MAGIIPGQIQAAPFIALILILFVYLAIITYVPDISTFLPRDVFGD